MRVSFKNPLVIRLDGKDVTKNKKYDLLNNYEGNFRNTLEKTAEFFTRKYKCLAILGSDEISFIFTDPLVVISDLDKEKWNTSNEIISVFSQYFFDYFNYIVVFYCVNIIYNILFVIYFISHKQIFPI